VICTGRLVLLGSEMWEVMMGWECSYGGYYMTRDCVICTGQLLLGSEMWEVRMGWECR
jgi:hypothetical protein